MLTPGSTPDQPAKPASPRASGIDAFPSLDEPSGGHEIRVTGVAGTGEDEDRAQFESAFPDLSGEVGYEAVSDLSWSTSHELTTFLDIHLSRTFHISPSSHPYTSAHNPHRSNPQAPKPVFNALSAQPYGASPYPQTAQPARPASSILPAPQFQNTLQPSQEDSEPIKAWRAKQQEEIKERDERDRAKREEMRGRAEKEIDRFYEKYNQEKEKTIRENK